jgi:predicted Zn-dependent peptidase
MNMLHQTMPNGATLLTCHLPDITINSLNIWLRHDIDIGAAHLIEHVVAGYLKDKFQPNHPSALSASTSPGIISFFSRVDVSATVSFFCDWLEAVQKLVTGRAEEEIRRESRVIAAELARAVDPQNYLNVALGQSMFHSIWEGSPESLALKAREEVFVGSAIVVLLLGDITAEDQQAVAEIIGTLPSRSLKAPTLTAMPEPVFYDATSASCGVTFSVRAGLGRDYALMNSATRIMIGRSKASLSQSLRAAGQAYKLDRTMVLARGGGVHTLRVNSPKGVGREVAEKLVQYLTKAPSGLTKECVALAMQETQLYLRLAQENKGVLASRIGKHFLNYGELPDASFMTDPFRNLSVAEMKGLICSTYFEHNKEIFDL